MIAALYVDKTGPYVGRADVDPWYLPRDARTYAGPWPVVAHPPCERWGRYWFGGPSCKVRRVKGDDGGCFAAALASVRRWGGVIEHPEASHAWAAYGIAKPPRRGGWVPADEHGVTCCVEQGHYGHRARKATWLYYVGDAPPPDLVWGPSVATLRIDRGSHSAEERRRASRVGAVALMGKRERRITPPAFAELLIDMARNARPTTETTP